MQERDFFTEKTETKPQTLQCPQCRQASEFQIRWIVRTKKPSLPPRANEDDRIRFKNARDYMIRVDDIVAPCEQVDGQRYAQALPQGKHLPHG